jgi:GNAT superfamily N-acetyltransferase
LARPGETDRVAELVALAGGVELEEDIGQTLDDGELGGMLVEALPEGRDGLVRRLPQAAEDPDALLEGLTTILVADHPTEGVLGAVEAIPPGQVLSQAPIPLGEALAGAGKVIKLRAVAADPDWRGRGIGTALIRLCVRLYTQVGYLILYGQFEDGVGLDDYYARLGFQILGNGVPLELPIFSRPVGAICGPGERFFLRRLQQRMPANAGVST